MKKIKDLHVIIALKNIINGILYLPIAEVVISRSQKMLHKESTAAWREVGGIKIYFRSLWEYRYSLWLQYQLEHKMIEMWAHEPKTFWFEDIKRGVRSYLPDFCVYKTATQCEWHEVKGYWDSKSLTKVKRFRKYYPDEKLILIDSKWFSANSKKLKLIIPEWEGK